MAINVVVAIDMMMIAITKMYELLPRAYTAITLLWRETELSLNLSLILVSYFVFVDV
jgi:hypothetical protein